MPWSTPPLRRVREVVRDNIRANLPGADALVPNSVLRVLADVTAGVCHLTLQFVDWLALQLIPDTAEHEWLDRHGFIWLVNADGSTGRKLATLASGTVNFIGEFGGVVVPRGTRLTVGGISIVGTVGTLEYETLREIRTHSGQLPSPVEVRALDPGAFGNLPRDFSLSLATPIPGIVSARAVSVTGGTDDETDDELRHRVLHRIRMPPQGGAQHDYVQWALAVPGVTRAWASPLEMGMGTVTVRFMMDSLRANNDGFPLPGDITAVREYLDKMRPVAVKDFFVEAPIKQPINFQTWKLRKATPEVYAAIEANLRKMLLEKAAPGQTIWAVWKSQAAMEAPEVEHFEMVDWTDDVMQSPGHMAVLGNLIFGSMEGPTRTTVKSE